MQRIKSSARISNAELHCYRKVSGEDVDSLVESLSPFVGVHPDLHFTQNHRRALRFRVMLIENWELRDNDRFIPEDFTIRPDNVLKIAERLPELLEPRDAVINKLYVKPSPKYGSVIRLDYRDEDAIINGEERAELWDSIADISEADPNKLRWNNYDPDTLLCGVGSNVPNGFCTHLQSYVNKLLPMEVSLEPMIDNERLKVLSATSSVADVIT